MARHNNAKNHQPKDAPQSAETPKPEPVSTRPEPVSVKSEPVSVKSEPVPAQSEAISAYPAAVSQPASDSTSHASSPSQEQIAQRAYELFLSQGGEHGRHEEHWMQAERELSLHR